MAMIAITTSNSIRVNALIRSRLDIGSLLPSRGRPGGRRHSPAPGRDPRAPLLHHGTRPPPTATIRNSWGQLFYKYRTVGLASKESFAFFARELSLPARIRAGVLPLL